MSSPIIYKIPLAQESVSSANKQNPFSTRVWVNATEETLSDIKRVTYHLHPTFSPDTLTSYTKENKFLVSFNNWGKFDLSATVEFRNGSSQKTLLPADNWKEPK